MAVDRSKVLEFGHSPAEFSVLLLLKATRLFLPLSRKDVKRLTEGKNPLRAVVEKNKKWLGEHAGLFTNLGDQWFFAQRHNLEIEDLVDNKFSIRIRNRKSLVGKKTARELLISLDCGESSVKWGSISWEYCMLAQVYRGTHISSQGHMTQPKLDGTRAVFIIRKEGFKAITRSGKLIGRPERFFPERCVPDILERLGECDIDGEIYLSDHDNPNGWLQAQRNGWIMNASHSGDGLEFCAFDLADVYRGFAERYARLLRIRKYITVILSEDAPDGDNGLENRLRDYASRGFEGVMIRDKLEVYKYGRTRSLLKYKPYFDATGKYVSIATDDKEGKNNGRIRGFLFVGEADGQEVSVHVPRTGFKDRDLTGSEYKSIINRIQNHESVACRIRHHGLTDDGSVLFASHEEIL